MPTDTFFRLPKEKQTSIFASAIKEFSRVPFHEASINQIIMNANIARGSFYMYFQDKEDLYSYIIEKQTEKLEIIFAKVLKKEKGDLIQTYLSLFQMMIEKLDQDKQKKLFRNIIMNTDFKNDSFFEKKHAKTLITDQLLKMVNFENMMILTPEEFNEVIDLIHMIFIHNLVMILKFDLDRMVAYQKLERQLMIVKNGLYRQEGGNEC